MTAADRVGWVLALAVVGALVAACGDNQPDPFDCAHYRRPKIVEPTACAPPNAARPSALTPCALGGGNFGQWAIDDVGLPAFELRGDYRCEITPTQLGVLEDPVHIVGDGYGTMAIAHAGGGLDVFSSARGSKFLVHRETLADPARPDFPAQLGGALSYLIDDDVVHSLQFADLPVTEARTLQQQRFGVGYTESVTTIGELLVTRRVYAASLRRALVSEVTIENTSDYIRTVGLAELYDINISQLLAQATWPSTMAPEAVNSTALTAPGISALEKQRARRDVMAQFRHGVAYDPRTRIASITTQQLVPTLVYESPALLDQYPDTMFLAPLDPNDAPDSAWLVDSELWPDASRTTLPRVNNQGRISARNLDIAGANQPGLLGLRISVTVPARQRVTKSFLFGTVGPDETAVQRLIDFRNSNSNGQSSATAAAAWLPRLVYAAFPNAANAAAMQRELAWSSYMLQALIGFDRQRSRRIVGQAGASRFVDGLEGTPSDLAMVADALTFIDGDAAFENLESGFGLHVKEPNSATARFASAYTGIGLVADPPGNTARTDGYFILPSMLARYVAASRDVAVLSRGLTFWPTQLNARSSLQNHLSVMFDQRPTLFGALGLLPLGTGDSSSGVLATAREPATSTGAASTVNVGYAALGFAILADYLGTSTDPASLDDRMRAQVTSQLALLQQHGWTGSWFLRGFTNGGNPLGAENVYLEPNLLAINAGLLDAGDFFGTATRLAAMLQTSIGPKIATPVPGGALGVVPGDPDLDVVQLSLTPWLVDAWVRLNFWDRAWQAMQSSSLFAHAQRYPALWYGMWTGPGSYQAPQAECGGCVALREAAYPALNAHAHASVLRSLPGLVGYQAAAFSAKIAPAFGVGDFAVQWPEFALSYDAHKMRVFFGHELVMNELRIRLPTMLQQLQRQPIVFINGIRFDFATVEGDLVIIDSSMLSSVQGQTFVEIVVQ